MEVLRDKTYLVGGAVRDLLLGREPKDLDFVVVGSSEEEMLSLGFKKVGESFPVFLHQEMGFEYALARRERKKDGDNAHTAFDVDISDVTLEEDLYRRDLTINAMAVKLSDYEMHKDSLALYVIDPFGGRKDLQQGKLRHVSEAFKEDPLRVLRVAKFAARYDFEIDGETLLEMEAIVVSGKLRKLSSERVWKEMDQALSYANPSTFFKVLDNIGAIEQLMPELYESNWYEADGKECDPCIKFALIVKDLSTDSLNKILNYLRPPTPFWETAKVVNSHYRMWQRVNKLKVSVEILRILREIDAYRNPERVKMLRYVAELIYGRQSYQARCGKVLERCFEHVKDISFKDVDQNLKGKEIKEAIDLHRGATILRYLEYTQEKVTG